MLTYKDVTQEQLDAMLKHRRKYSYTNDEAVEVFNLVKLFVDPHQGTCLSCNTNLRDAKTKLNGYLANNEELIVQHLESQKQAINYVQNNKICECGQVIEDKRAKRCKECKSKSK